MKQGKFDFGDPDDKPSFDRRSDFFIKKPVEPVAAHAGPATDTGGAGTPVPEPTQTSAPAAPDKSAPAKKVEKEPVILSVTQLNRSVKFALADAFPGKITVSGEISNYKPHGSGHLYFSLKDQDSSITAAMWKSSTTRLKFEPENGMAVLASGRLEVYEPQGKYQLIVEKLELAGTGSLELAFRQLAEKLRNEGLFDPARKKTLPTYPQTIAIVTSPTGAAIADIGQTLNRRWGFARKLLFPVLVQGPQAAGEIVAALREIDRRKAELGIEVIILARGGGSLEDLWPFNEEIVARAIAACSVPIISGVGHEIDVTIADMVADVRAATPTAAAELAVPVAQEELADITELARTLALDLKNMLRQAKESLTNIADRPFFKRGPAMLETPRQRLDELQMRLANLLSGRVNRIHQELDFFHNSLKKIEPHSKINSLLLELEQKRNQMERAMASKLANQYNYLNNKQLQLTRSIPTHRVTLANDQLRNLIQRLALAQESYLCREANSLRQYGQLLNNLDHRQVLKRGYTVTRLSGSPNILTGPASAATGDIISTEFFNGTIDSKVTRINKND